MYEAVQAPPHAEAKLKSPEPAHTKAQSSVDLEKGWLEGISTGGTAQDTSPRQAADHDHTSFRYISSSSENILDGNMDDAERQVGHLKILLYLAFLNPLPSLVCSIYGLAVTLLIIPFGPVLHLLKGFPPMPGQIIRALSPILTLQLRLIESSLLLKFHPPSSAWRIFLVVLGSPFAALAVQVAAWVAVAFWIYAAILGEPNQRTGREKEMEGRAAASWVRRVWERWLLLAIGP